ncbi:MAG TPA: tRNA lysidine(34) synthetase TilS [Rhizomicrobium sp.]
MTVAGAPWPCAVAVSGGSDSLALMFLLRDWAKRAGLPPPVMLCVDHSLRPESAGEARKVLRQAKAAGLPARILVRKGEAPRSDIEAAAREARYRLMGEWAKKNSLKAIYVGHTRDDQAETFLLRLARGSGVDGLAAMRMVAPYPVKGFSGLMLVRPLLAFGREELRDELRARKQVWLDDPMNADPHFARVRIRNAWPALEAMGLSKERVADAAAHLARARAALDKVSQAVLARACRFDRTEALLDPAALTGAPHELGLRALAAVLMEVSENPYRPRFERLERLFSRIADGSIGAGRTLHGCRIGPAPSARACFGRGTLLVRREGNRRKTMKNNG